MSTPSPKPAPEKTSATTSYQAEPAPERMAGVRSKRALFQQRLSNACYSLQEVANGIFLFENALVHFDSA